MGYDDGIIILYECIEDFMRCLNQIADVIGALGYDSLGKRGKVCIMR